MAGRPKSRPRRETPAPPPPPPRKPRAPRTLTPQARAERMVERVEAEGNIRLSEAYGAALAVEAAPDDALDPDALRVKIAEGLKARRAAAGKSLRVADILASSLITRAIDPNSRDGVLAAREVADRTEGPVVQRAQVESVRYLVSVTPAGSLREAPARALDAASWEATAQAEYQSARRLREADEAQVASHNLDENESQR